MTFDYTTGKVRYAVNVHTETMDDRYYFSDLEKATDFYHKLFLVFRPGVARISLYDMETDTYVEKGVV